MAASAALALLLGGERRGWGGLALRAQAPGPLPVLGSGGLRQSAVALRERPGDRGVPRGPKRDAAAELGGRGDGVWGQSRGTAQALGLAGESPPPGPGPAVPRHDRWPRQVRVARDPAGAQPSQLTLDPPWTPVFVREKVSLTCRGPGASVPTRWYVDEQLWQPAGPDRVWVSGNKPSRSSYRCQSRGAELSPPITLSFSNDWLALQVPARALLEGDRLPLRCRGWQDTQITRVRFYHKQKVLGGPSQGNELLLPPLQLSHAGHYRCEADVGKVFPQRWVSALVAVAVQELFSVPHLEGPAEPPEGAPLTLGCLSRRSPLRPLARLQHLFYQDGTVVGGPQESPQLRLPAAELSHSGNYSCEVRTETASVQKRSAPLTVTVRRVPVSGVSLTAKPPGGQVAEGDRLVLGCSVAAGTGPLAFSWHHQGSAAPLATGPSYELQDVRHRDGGSYHCTATNGGTAANSPPLWVTVLVPVAGATIAMARTEPSVPSGESLNLSCSVQAGTAPVTFTWLRDGQELGSGPVLALGPVGPAHAGTYHCLATNRLGGHRVFQARSRALALSVTPPARGWRQPGTAVAAGLSVSLLLLLAAAVGWHLRRRHCTAAGKSSGRDPAAPPEPEGRRPEPAAPPEAPGDGEVLYAQIVVPERGGGTSPARSPRGSPRSAPPREPPVTYAVLRLPSEIYENVP
ncbi:Fc receptor-like protein 2 [Athene noctua]|uniref:Fc receptor-like protein 2 n=1 Tax=Athene noctua TaxID=126797 RepID=UPI003EB811E2